MVVLMQGTFAQAHDGDFDCNGICNAMDLLIHLNESGTSCNTDCVADMNCDGVVNSPDLMMFLSFYGEVSCPADYDNDGDVDTDDFSIFVGYYTAGCNMADWNCDGQLSMADILNFPYETSCRPAPAEMAAADQKAIVQWFKAHDSPILIAPNPVQGPVTIASVAGFLDADAILEVIGTDGRVVAVGPADRMELDMHHQPAGVYVVRASLGSWSQTAKLIKVD